MPKPVYPEEVTVTLPRNVAASLHQMVGKRPISDLWARRAHNAFVAELDKTVDDIQHEKLEAATAEVQSQAFATKSADIHVRGEAMDIGVNSILRPMTDEQIKCLENFGLTREFLAPPSVQKLEPYPTETDPVDGNDPDDIARAVYEFLNERFLTPPKTARERFELCRQVVAFVRHHLPEEKPQTNSYTVTLEMPRYKVSWLKRLLENRMRRESISEMLIKDFKLALGEEVDDDGR